MNIAARVFQSILTTAHHIISGDDIDNYYEGFNGMLSFKDPTLFAHYHEIGESIASILFQKKIGVLIMAYDTLAFCLRFQKNCSFHSLNLRLIAYSLKDLPKSTGDPIFLAGLNSVSVGFGWVPVLVEDFEEKAEIFPLIDFEGICIYYATPKKARSFDFHCATSQSRNDSQIATSQSTSQILDSNVPSDSTSNSFSSSQSRKSSQKSQKKQSQQNMLLSMLNSYSKD